MRGLPVRPGSRLGLPGLVLRNLRQRQRRLRLGEQGSGLAGRAPSLGDGRDRSGPALAQGHELVGQGAQQPASAA